jgi:hypothetical protein
MEIIKEFLNTHAFLCGKQRGDKKKKRSKPLIAQELDRLVSLNISPLG